MKKILRGIFEVIWGNFALKHWIFTGEQPSEADKQEALKMLRLL